MKFIINRYFQKFLESKDSGDRETCGVVVSSIGIGINLLLFLGKFLVGNLFSSISIVADAFNNLSDVASSVISFISFKLSNKPPDEEHPYGHQRGEYIASFIVAFLVLNLGLDTIASSMKKIMTPQLIGYSGLTIGVLTLSIVLKLFLYGLNKEIGIQMNSTVMKATATDSISDVFATTGVLIATVVSPILGFSLDGYMGLFVAVLIMKAGVDIVKESIDKLLGGGMDGELVAEMKDYIMCYDEMVLGVHDMMIHSYGENANFASVHIEVCAESNMLTSHDMIDGLEARLYQEFGISFVVHLDPVIQGDAKTKQMIEQVDAQLKQLDARLDIHDFRVIPCTPHDKLIFDVEVPFDSSLDKKKILGYLIQTFEKRGEIYQWTVHIDRCKSKR